MAKVAFSKLHLVKKEEVKTIIFNEVEIEVKQYLPIADKLTLIGNVLNNSSDDNNFVNPVKVDVCGILEIIYAYTNLNFTDKQKEDPAKLYDLLETNGFINAVIDAIPELEYTTLVDSINETIEAYYKYKTSALGILDAASADYSGLDFDAQKIQQEIGDPNNITLLKDVMDKLG